MPSEIASEARRVEEDATYSSKGHYNAADFWSRLYYWLGIPSAILSAVAGASALSRFEFHAEIAGGISILVAILTSLNVFLNPQQKALAHHRSGSEYNVLKNNARVFRRVELASSPSSPTEGLRKLLDWRDELNRKSPPISKRFFRSARKGIEEGEADYSIDRKRSE